MENQAPVIVFDNDSSYLKEGLSDVEIPSVTMPALIGRPMLRYAEKTKRNRIKANNDRR